MSDFEKLGFLVEELRMILEKKDINTSEFISKTGEEMFAALGKFKGYDSLTPDQWNKLGQFIKRQAGTTSVFTGALPAIMWYLHLNPKGLPMTADFASKYLAKTKIPLRLRGGVDGGRVLAILADDGYLEPEFVVASDIVKANHTRADEKIAKADPKGEMSLYFAGSSLVDLSDWLRNVKINLQVEHLTKVGFLLSERV